MGKEMNAVEKWRKNQKEKLKKKKKDIDSRMKEKGDEPRDKTGKTRDHTKQHVQIYKTSEVSAEIQAKRDLYWEEQRKLERIRESAKKQETLTALPSHLKIKLPLEPYPFDCQDYDDIYYDCLRDHRATEDRPSNQQIVKALQTQYQQKLSSLADAASQRQEALDQDQDGDLDEDDIEEEDKIQEDKAGKETGRFREERFEVIAEKGLSKRGDRRPLEEVPETDPSKYLIQEGPQLTQAFLLRKEKPNFIPKQLAEKFKRDQEAKEQQELSAHVDKELLEEEMSKQVIKKAELQTHKLTVPRPQFTLDEDDEEFED